VFADLLEWLVLQDERAFLALNSWLHAVRDAEVHEYLRLASALGNGHAAWLAVVAVLLVARPLRRGAFMAFEASAALVLVGWVQHHLKYWANRPRPQLALADAFAEGRAFAAFGDHAQRNAFPSGHAGVAFALAALVFVWTAHWDRRFHRWGARVLATVLAVSTAVARVYAGLHYPGDVVAGALIGVLLAVFVSFLLSRIRRAWARRAAGADAETREFEGRKSAAS
jgi:membrane-associated phospholipid phosphatase